jgi:hypothetical protein
VKLAGDGTHMVVRDHDPIACGMSLNDAANFVTFLRVSVRARRTQRSLEALRRRGAQVAYRFSSGRAAERNLAALMSE